MKLGQKVKCKGYLKKTGNFIQRTDDLPKDLYSTLTNGNFEVEKHVAIINGHVKRLNFDEEVKTKEIVQKEFSGIIVGKKEIALGIYVTVEYGYDCSERDWIRKCDFIYCYKVYYASGKSRLVPCDMVEVEE